MSYATGEALILTQIQALTEFNGTGPNARASQGNWKILNRGKGRSYAIIYRGPFTREQSGLGGAYVSNWTTMCEVWTRYKDDSTTMTTLQARVDEIIERFDQHNRADDTTGNIRDVFVGAGALPEERWVRGGNGPAFYMQLLTIEWQEENNETIQN